MFTNKLLNRDQRVKTPQCINQGSLDYLVYFVPAGIFVN
jgi:hypothetical protein